MPEDLCTAAERHNQDTGQSFPNTDQPRLVINISFFSHKIAKSRSCNKSARVRGQDRKILPLPESIRFQDWQNSAYSCTEKK